MYIQTIAGNQPNESMIFVWKFQRIESCAIILAKAIPLLLLEMSHIWDISSEYTFEIFSYDLILDEIRTWQRTDIIGKYLCTRVFDLFQISYF